MLDNALQHTSKVFKNHLLAWKKRGLLIKFLPPYSPELNLVEILWRFIKYRWLAFSAYGRFAHLKDGLEDVLRNVGKKISNNFCIDTYMWTLSDLIQEAKWLCEKATCCKNKITRPLRRSSAAIELAGNMLKLTGAAPARSAAGNPAESLWKVNIGYGRRLKKHIPLLPS